MALKVIKAPTVRFNNGIEFPIFGLGTWKVSLENCNVKYVQFLRYVD
jgi:diketogulonate reductase-like aldo/keto reductase